MTTKLFLISVCIGGSMKPAQMHTTTPTQTILELVKSGEIISNVTIKSA